MLRSDGQTVAHCTKTDRSLPVICLFGINKTRALMMSDGNYQRQLWAKERGLFWLAASGVAAARDVTYMPRAGVS